MKKKTTLDLITIKVTRQAARNFRLAAALSGKPQYEISEEGSCFVHGKYMTKEKLSTKIKKSWK